MKMLYVTSLSGHRINGFMRSAIVAANSLGIEFVMACNMDGADKLAYEQDCKEYGISTVHIDFDRNPLSIKNVKAKKQLLSLMKNEHFDFVHCNTPVGGLLGRLCAKRAGIKKIIYQAHGFHFFKGAPKINWIIYYPVETILSRYTDILITIAKDDFELAKKMYAKEVAYVHGVGIDIDRFQRRDDLDRNILLRNKLGIQDNKIVMLSVGELNRNKNHSVVLKALRDLSSNIVYVICGDGELRQEYEKYIEENHLESRVFLMGFRSDIIEFYRMADLFVFPSLREGIPGAIMEAISTGVPVIASDIRGIRDIVVDDYYRFSPFDSIELAKLIKDLIENDNKCNIESNIEALKPYLFSNVVNEIRSIYERTLKCIDK